MKLVKSFFLSFLAFLFISSCEKKDFIKVNDTHFIKNGKPYHYIGTNYWYGAMLGAKSGDRERLKKELDELKALGITNLRVLACSDGGDQDFAIRPATQPTLGKYNEEYLEGLDFFLDELGKRDMDAVLYLTNSWDWSGGMPKMLEWMGYGKIPDASTGEVGWTAYTKYMANFYKCEPCKKAMMEHMKFIISRTNTINGKKYIDDPAIMAWQVANEPRIWGVENERLFTNWLNTTVAEIKKIDPNHLVSTGSEGSVGSNLDINTFARTHKNPQIDYLTAHVWPKNWGWYKKDDEKNSLRLSIDTTMKYIEQHIVVAEKMRKPLVLEEFGFPREKESYDKNSSVENRNQYYKAIFNKLEHSIKNKKAFTGLNFWGYGGVGKNNPKDGKWYDGDDFTGDPPQEPQGLNSVFSTDKSTLQLVKDFYSNLKIK